MAQWKGKSRGGVLGYRIFIWILKTFGLGFGYFVLRFVAFYFFLFVPSSTRLTYHYFRKRIGYGFWKSIYKVYENYYIFGQVLVDKLAILSEVKTNFTYEFDGRHHLTDLVKNQKGGVLLSGHIGNWEIAGHFLKHIGAKVNIVMLDAEHRQLKKYLSNIMVKPKFEVIGIKEDGGHIFSIKKAIDNNEVLCMHADRYVDGAKKTLINFLGGKAYFPEGPFYLAAKFNLPVIFVFAMKEGKNHYHFYARPFDYEGKEVEEIIKDFALMLEKMIHKYPNQWFNYYNFWESPAS